MRYALVTGGSRGIGRATCLRLADEGFGIILNYSRDEEGAGAAAEVLRERGGGVHLLRGDVSDPGAVEGMGRELRGAGLEVSVLINNAGIYRRCSFDDLDPGAWERTIAVNLSGPYLMARQFVPDMARAGWGRIVNLSSVLAFTGSSGGADYAAAKAGLLGLTRSLARELGPKGITVNAVAPGPIDTDIIADDTPEKRAGRIAITPTGRIGQPEDVADTIAFLASDRAGHITGQVLHVNGGYHMG